MGLYYSDAYVSLYEGDCRENLEWLEADVLVTDPPYGMNWAGGRSGTRREGKKVVGDESTELRDEVLALWGDKPALVFGTWRVQRPATTRHVLIWNKMNAFSGYFSDLPWRMSTEEVYVLGKGFVAEPKVCSVLSVPNMATMDAMRLDHPTPKPVELLRQLLAGCPPEWVIADPFAGTGPTLRAAKDLGRKAIGCEIVREYCNTIASVCGQETLFVL